MSSLVSTVLNIELDVDILTFVALSHDALLAQFARIVFCGLVTEDGSPIELPPIKLACLDRRIRSVYFLDVKIIIRRREHRKSRLGEAFSISGFSRIF